jgi:hypothetical protein
MVLSDYESLNGNIRFIENDLTMLTSAAGPVISAIPIPTLYSVGMPFVKETMADKHTIRKLDTTSIIIPKARDI